MCTSHCGTVTEGRQQPRVVRVLQSLCPSDTCGEPQLFVVGEGVTGGWGVGVGGSLGLSRKMPEVGRQP